jgi:PST family polysaccharide transporter
VPTEATAADVTELKRKSARGGVVTVVAQGLTIAIQLASTIILARLLSPSDYGTIAMVTAVTSFAGLFRDLGLSSAAIQKKSLTSAQQNNLFWLNVAVGALLTLLVSTASPLVVWFYGKPDLLWVTVALSSSFLIASFGSQHGALMVRNMQFGRKALPGILGALVGFGVSVALALAGWSYWSLVWGNLSGAVVTTISLYLLSPFRPGWIVSEAGIRELLKFGANVTAYDFVNYFHRNFDNLLIGKFVGTDALGLYSRAYALLMLPISSLRGPITAVGFPALSRLQDQPEAFRDYYRKVTHLLALGSMPFTAFLFARVGEIIQILLGPAWRGVVPIFAILALVAFIQPALTLWGIVVLSRGMGRRYLHIGIFNSVCCVLGFVAGLPWGAVGVASGYAIATYVTAIPTLLWAFRGTPVVLKDFLAGTARPFAASIFAALSLVAVSGQWATLERPAANLLISILVFVLLYSTCLRVLPGGRQDFLLIGKLVSSIMKSCFRQLTFARL